MDRGLYGDCAGLRIVVLPCFNGEYQYSITRRGWNLWTAPFTATAEEAFDLAIQTLRYVHPRAKVHGPFEV
jgi:hypothetical protein